ncbi:MAG: hypothetical protein ACKOBX_08095 [Bacteroidota bacterium]
MRHVIPRILRLRPLTIIERVHIVHIDQDTRTLNLLPLVTPVTFKEIEKDGLRHMKIEASM